MFSFNVDVAVECVKSIIDNTQCVTCGELSNSCARFPCGHSFCKPCAQTTEECVLCISSPASYLIDKPQSLRFNNARALLTTFQDTFKIDVHKRQRISDHLKVEKLVFPECIQAPLKYGNKRKSLNISNTNKENISPNFFPGEEIKGCETTIMKKSAQYVQNWLNQHDSMPQNLPRRPFGDININTQSLAQKPNKNIAKLKSVTTQANAKTSTYRKKTHLKSIHKISLLDNIVTNDLEIKKQQRPLEIKNQKPWYSDNDISRKCEKNESGIVLDDEPIVIEDVDTNIIDKDEQAWLAVLQAAEKDEYEFKLENKLQTKKETNNNLDSCKITDSTLENNGKKPHKIEPIFSKSVLYYKRGSLLETCKLCNNSFMDKFHSSSTVDDSSDVSIIINNSSFITTIKFTQCDEKKQVVDKNTVAIQTDKDISLFEEDIISFEKKITTQKRKSMIDNDDVPIKMLKTNGITESLDVFDTGKDVKQNSTNGSLKANKCVVIEESDTDSNLSCDNTHEVLAEVHRPDASESVECGILRTLTQREYENKPKRQVRGHTPNSSNSSDKENLDPNRKKVVKSGKKLKQKNKK